jgi:hypothetical protein
MGTHVSQDKALSCEEKTNKTKQLPSVKKSSKDNIAD